MFKYYGSEDIFVWKIIKNLQIRMIFPALNGIINELNIIKVNVNISE